jgi:hypothetical protein
MCKGLGQVIREKQGRMGAKKNDLMLMIKPAEAAGLGDIVDILDEVQINGVTRYAIMDLTEEERQLIGGKTGVVF